MLSYDIATQLINSNVGVSPSDGTASSWVIYHDRVEPPAGPDKVIVIVEYAGQSQGITLDGLYDIQSSVQILIRSKTKDYTGGMNKIKDIIEKLNGLSNTTINGRRYVQILFQNGPMSLGSDERGRYRWTINLNVMRGL